MSTMKAQALPTAGRDLLLELHRNKDRLPPYNTKLVRACFQDLQDSVQELQHQVRAASSSVAGSGGGGGEQQQPQYQQEEEEGGGKKPSMSTRPSILHQNERIQRQKRYLLAYHRHRMELLKEQQHPGAGGTSTGGGGGGAANAQEVEFQNDYRELRALYAEQVFELDAVPPTSHMVQVRVLRDMQQVVLESGRAVTFTKGSWLYLPRADVLEFLRDGTLELKEGEEVDF